MRLRQPVEVLYLALMQRWQQEAPPDGELGLLDGVPVRNSQIARMVFLLKKIAAGNMERTFNALARHTRREDGESYISKDSSWMIEPAELVEGWFFEGCTSLAQKQSFLHNLVKLGLSADFVHCAAEFVAGRSVAAFFPSEAESEELLRGMKNPGADEG